MKVIFAFIFSLIVLIAVSCGNSPEVKKKDSGLHYIDDTVGVGRVAKEGNLVTINFRVWIMKDSSDDFSNWEKDSSKMQQKIEDTWMKGRPYKFVLGREYFYKRKRRRD